MWLLLIILLLPAVEADRPITKQGCNDTCGDVSIPFPFGIGAGCFLDNWFEIECRKSPIPNGSISTKPFLSKFDNIEVMQVSTKYDHYGGEHWMIVGIPPLNACVAETTQKHNTSTIDLTGSPYSFSYENVFMVEGCSGIAVLRDQSNNFMAGCGTVCNTAPLKNSCYGECCQTRVKELDDFYHIDAYPQEEDSSSGGLNQSCLVVTLINIDSVSEYAGKLSSSDVAPVMLHWDWISKLGADNDSHAICTHQADDILLECICTHNRYGNAYVNNGCQVPEQCKRCRGRCIPQWNNTEKFSDPTSYYCEKKPLQLATILGFSISLGIVLLVIGLYGLYCFVKRIREIRRRAKFFKRNGGLLLHQQLSSNEGVVDGTKIFTIVELDKATNQFNDNRILGQGGQGTVYKGMLVDGRIVAIKKAKLLDESQLEQFINEVVILSQVNHRNVVKLLGCCLETEVPLLVYEFIPNGSLFEHIHDPDEDFSLTWEKRIKIAQDSASAIAYLHSSSSIPIFHRDIKSSNILLDERHRAKVSDFGSSKTIAIDQTHLTTLVQGTMGYLDPEYFQSYQFTEKSDVYSFGVVLLELLTSKKPIFRDESKIEQKNLVTEFLFLAKKSRLSEILDPEIVIEAKEDELMIVMELATRCINRSGNLRPTMKEVAMTLEMIIKSPAQLSTWFQQQEAFGVPTENSVTETAQTSDGKCMSNPHLAGFVSPFCIDMKPHFPDTI